MSLSVNVDSNILISHAFAQYRLASRTNLADSPNELKKAPKVAISQNRVTRLTYYESESFPSKVDLLKPRKYQHSSIFAWRIIVYVQRAIIHQHTLCIHSIHTSNMPSSAVFSSWRTWHVLLQLLEIVLALVAMFLCWELVISPRVAFWFILTVGSNLVYKDSQHRLTRNRAVSPSYSSSLRSTSRALTPATSLTPQSVLPSMLRSSCCGGCHHLSY